MCHRDGNRVAACCGRQLRPNALGSRQRDLGRYCHPSAAERESFLDRAPPVCFLHSEHDTSKLPKLSVHPGHDAREGAPQLLTAPLAVMDKVHTCAAVWTRWAARCGFVPLAVCLYTLYRPLLRAAWWTLAVAGGWRRCAAVWRSSLRCTMCRIAIVCPCTVAVHAHMRADCRRECSR